MAMRCCFPTMRNGFSERTGLPRSRATRRILGGLSKGPFLKEFEPDFFFDDQTRHCESAALAGPTGHVLSGIANER